MAEQPPFEWVREQLDDMQRQWDRRFRRWCVVMLAGVAAFVAWLVLHG